MTRKRLDKHQNALFGKVFWGKWFKLELKLNAPFFLYKFLKRGHILKLRLPSKSILNSSYWNHLQRIAQVTDDFSNLSKLDQEISASVRMLLENTYQTYQDLAAHISSFWSINPISGSAFVYSLRGSKDELGLIGYFTCLHTVTFFTQLLIYVQSFTASLLNNGQQYLIDTCKREVNDRNLWLVFLSLPQKPLWVAPFPSSHRPPRAFYLFLLE